MKKRGELIPEYLVKTGLIVATVVLIIIFIGLATGSIQEMLERLINIIRFG